MTLSHSLDSRTVTLRSVQLANESFSDLQTDSTDLMKIISLFTNQTSILCLIETISKASGL